MSIESLFNTRCTVMKPVSGGDSWGSGASFVKVSEVPCRIRAVSGREWLDGKMRNEASHKAYLPAGTEVAPKYRLVSGTRTYDIVPPVNDAGGGAGSHIELLLKEVIS